MRRIDIQVNETMEKNIYIFKEAESIKTWAKACLKLLDYGLRFYCKKDVNNLTNNNDLIMAKLKEFQNENRQLCLAIDEHVKSIEKNNNENN